MQTTPTIGLKTPEGPDPFLMEDFVGNWDAIDDAFAADRAAIAAASNASTLQGHPASYFYSSDNPPPAGTGGTGGTTDNRPYTWLAVGNVNQSRAAGASVTYQGPRVVVPTGGGRLNLDGYVYVNFPANAPAIFAVSTAVDGVNADASSIYSGAGVPDLNLSGGTRMTVPFFGAANVAAGNHTSSITVSVSSGGGLGPITVYFFKIRATLAQAGTSF